jgi:hypothetical protein
VPISCAKSSNQRFIKFNAHQARLPGNIAAGFQKIHQIKILTIIPCKKCNDIIVSIMHHALDVWTNVGLHDPKGVSPLVL